VRLFDREPIKTLQSAWEQLARRAEADGGELVLREGGPRKCSANTEGA
jgi:hypothetical protein